jgi:hypothetical protein
LKEEFLHYVWKNQYLDHGRLKTTEGLPVYISDPGSCNEDSGPDFINAKFNIGETYWQGFVEIHLKSSDWLKHKHQEDANYDLVLLHVVYQHDCEIKRQDGSRIPTVEIGGLIKKQAFLRFHSLEPVADILCRNMIKDHEEVLLDQYTDQLAMRRIDRKSKRVLDDLKDLDYDWDGVAFRRCGIGFGFKINEKGFSGIVQSIPYPVIRKHSGSLFQLEALLFGAGGLLSMRPVDQYQYDLKCEYEYLAAKYRLGVSATHPVMWNTLRARPANYPTLRVAQLAALLNKHPSLFGAVMNIRDPEDAYRFFSVETSGYWNKTFFFGRELKNPQITIGKNSVHSLIINCVIPLQEAWARFRGTSGSGPELLNRVPAEKNRITERWRNSGIVVKSALESQALIELYNNQCQRKACLECTIGKRIMAS